MKEKVSKRESVVFPIHFEDRGGAEFERLCFAHILRMKEWKSIDWYGQLGGDSGRDIWGISEDKRGRNESICFQCANLRSLKFNKSKQDIDKIVPGPNAPPDRFVLIAGGKVSANMKSKITTYAKSKGIKDVEIWSGVEFEERLRRDSPSLIRRFVEGEAFPETVKDLKLFVTDSGRMSDGEIISLITQCFDRPAFITLFMSESSIPAFKKAITDTIEVLNTGVHRLRDGTIIRRIPSRHDIHDKAIRKTLADVVGKLTDLRQKYDEFIKTGDIRPCGCNDPDCSIFMLSSKACCVMDEKRYEILELLRSVYPEFFLARSGRSI